MACSTDGTMAYVYCGKMITGTAITKEQQVHKLPQVVLTIETHGDLLFVDCKNGFLH